MSQSALFAPFPVRDLEIRNRLWVSPMCQYQALGRDGVATAWHQAHLGALARGGAGLVMIEATGVVPEGRISPFCLGLWNDDQRDALAPIVAFARSMGATVGIQLGHAGRKASTHPWMPDAPAGSVDLAEGGWETVAPSALAFGDYRAPRALSVAEIEALVAAFVASAGRAVTAGIQVIELHAAHGYLLHEFLSPLSNRRSDGYGGDLAGRARLLREVARAVRAAHPSTALFVRVSASEWRTDGFTPEEAREVAGWLAEDGVDLVDVSSGGNVPDAPIVVGPGYQVPFARTVREAGLPVAAVGMITSAAQAETLLRASLADAIFVGRPMLNDPHLPLRWARELREEPAAPASYWRAGF